MSGKRKKSEEQRFTMQKRKRHNFKGPKRVTAKPKTTREEKVKRQRKLREKHETG